MFRWFVFPLLLLLSDLLIFLDFIFDASFPPFSSHSFSSYLIPFISNSSIGFLLLVHTFPFVHDYIMLSSNCLCSILVFCSHHILQTTFCPSFISVATFEHLSVILVNYAHLRHAVCCCRCEFFCQNFNASSYCIWFNFKVSKWHCSSHLEKTKLSLQDPVEMNVAPRRSIDKLFRFRFRLKFTDFLDCECNPYSEVGYHFCDITVQMWRQSPWKMDFTFMEKLVDNFSPPITITGSMFVVRNER